MKILIWTGHHDPLDAAIKFLTHGRGSHAAFLRSDGVTVHEAFWPRVRDRRLEPEELPNIEAFSIKDLNLVDHAHFERLFDRNIKVGIEYSIADLFRFALNRPSKDEHHTFCSRYVLHCCKTILPASHLPLVRIPNGDWASPRDLRISPLLAPATL